MNSFILQSSQSISISERDTEVHKMLLCQGKLNSCPLILIANIQPMKLQDKGTLTLQWQFSNKKLTVYTCIKNFKCL